MTSPLKTLTLFAGLSLAGCKFTVTNGLVSSHSDEVEAFSRDVLEDFYARDTDGLLARVADGAGFTADALDATYEFISETSRPDAAVAANRTFQQQNARKYYVTIFHTPRDKGREQIKITVSPEGDRCCELYGLHINQLIGAEYVMDAAETEADGPGN